MATTQLEVLHHFDAAHRLPAMGGKCASLHGHTWRVAARVTGLVHEDGTVIDFGDIKSRLRIWIDSELDHGTMLGIEDPLVPLLRDNGTKVYTHGGLVGWWPTVENVAALIGSELGDMLKFSKVDVAEVRITETVSNVAVWSPR